MLDNVQEGASSTTDRTASESQNEGDPNFTTPAAPSGVTTMKRMPASMEHDDLRQMLPLQKRARTTEATDSQKRTIAIQVALSKPVPDDGIPLPTFPKPTLALPGGINVSSQDVRAEEIKSCSQSIGSSSGKTGSSTLDGAPSSRAVDADNDEWLLLQTPKRPEFEASAAAFSSPEESPPVQVAKGKHKANEECHSEKAAVTVSILLDQLPRIYFAHLRSQFPAESSLRRRYSAASISHSLEDLADLPNYLRTLETGNEIKDMKIRHLENEVERCASFHNLVLISLLKQVTSAD